MPPSLYGHSAFSRRLQALLPPDVDREVFVDLSQASFVRPDGIAHLIATIFALLKRGYRLTVSRPRAPAVDSYLRRTDVWGLLARNGITVPEELAGFNHGAAPGLVECQEIHTSGDLEENLRRVEVLAKQLRGALGVAGLDRKLYSLFIELASNAAEHSRSEHGAFVMAQVYRRLPEIELSVVDVGRGIRAALYEAHGFQKDLDAVRAALEDGITGRVDAAGRPTGAGGCGLATARYEAARLVVRSGSAVFESLPMVMTPNGPEVPREEELLVMRGKECPPLDGTIVTAVIRPRN
jgi:hypothetical protein